MAKVKSVEVNGRTWTQEDIKELLKHNDKALIKAILVIYSYQTETEKAWGETKFDNGMGFNGLDANILSSFAEQYNKRHFLTDKQLFIARKKMPKYAGQLLKHMEAKAV